MTEADLCNVYSGESMVHVRYLIYADQAEKEVFRQVALLFRAIAFRGEYRSQQSHQAHGPQALQRPRGSSVAAPHLPEPAS